MAETRDAPELLHSRSPALSHLVAALAAAALGALMVTQSWDRPFLVPGRGVGAFALPLVTGVVLLVMGLLLLIRILLGRDRGARAAWPSGLGQGRVIGLVALSATYVVLLDRAGFLLANLLVGLACLRLLGSYAWWLSGLLAVAIAIGLVVVFEVALGVSLPRGPLGY